MCNEKNKVSVVIPVYNCEDYIENCVDSLLKQTYTNIELILVNDGSTDNSKVILEKMKEKDARIVVVNKENEGVAKARNIGGSLSSGEWITFVDADDFVAQTYIETLLGLAMKYNADFSICEPYTFYDKKDISDENGGVVKENVYSNIEAFEKLLYRNKITSSPWAKLMKTQLFLQLPFPENTLFEDLGVVYKWISNANIVAHTSERLYYYLLRVGSRQHSEFNINKMDLYNLSKEILEYTEVHFPKSINAAYNRMFVSCLQLLRDISISDYKKEYLLIKKEIKTLRKEILFDKKSRGSTRILALICYGNLYLVKLFGDLANKLVYKFKIRKAF